MVASVASPADVVNLALAKGGFKGRIGALFEGSDAARKVLDFYAQTRDATLRAANWGFAERFAAAVASGGVPPPIWAYEWQYPADCLQLRNMFNSTYMANPSAPLPVLWTIGNNAALGQRVIWTNLAAPTLVYTGQVTNPALWDPLFVETFATELAKGIALTIGMKDAIKILMDEEKDLIPLAEDTLG